MNHFTVTPISSFADNYIWLLQDNLGHAVVIDPGDADPVLQYLDKNQLELQAILITHHHHDHVGGVRKLKNIFSKKIVIYAPKNEIDNIKCYDIAVSEGDVVDLNFCTFDILDIPGHTLGHIAYVGQGKLFCGDTLFSAGCGRVFEGTMEQMFASLTKIKNLPHDTEVYCAHEYTESNLRFASIVEPENQAIKSRQQEVKLLREKNKPTLPSLLREECLVNPFLRCDYPEIKQVLQHRERCEMEREVDVFTSLRKWKDGFAG